MIKPTTFPRQYGSGRRRLRSVISRWAQALVHFVFCILLLSLTPVAHSDEPVHDAAISYRRVFVPADNVAAWPRHGEKYLPIDAQEFERWVDQANRDRGNEGSGANIASAEYFARLEGNQLVNTRGHWKIALHGAEPAVLPLDNLSLAVRDARWSDPTGQPLRLGTWGDSGKPATKAGLEVSRPGTMEFSWQAPSQVLSNGIQLDWALPAATVSRIVLELPVGKEPHIEGGIVLDQSPIPASSPEQVATYVRWAIAFNAAEARSLRIVDAQETGVASAIRWKLRDNTSYSITQNGLSMQTRWRIESTSSEPAADMTILVPRDVQLQSIRIGKTDVSWQASTNASGETSAAFHLPNASTDEATAVTVSAWQPLEANKLWRLPRLKLAESLWIAGDVELSIDDSLELCQLSPSGCVEVDVAGVADTKAPVVVAERWRLAAFSDNPQIEVLIRQYAPLPVVDIGTALSLTDADISGTQISRWHVAKGSIHTLVGVLANNWEVESIDSAPAAGVTEWFVDQVNGRRLLTVQLGAPITRADHLQLTVRGRLSRPALREPLMTNALRLVRWRGIKERAHWSSFKTLEPFEVQPTDGLPVAAIEQLSAQHRQLLEPTVGNAAAFDLRNAARRSGVRFAARAARFSTDIQVDAALNGDKLSQTCTLTIKPQSGRIEQLTVLATHPLGDNVRWTDAASGAALVAHRIPRGDAAAAASVAADQWIVQLPQPSAGEIRIVAQSEAAIADPRDLPLVAVAGASDQSGEICVHTPALDPLGIDSHGIMAIAAPKDLTANPPSHSQVLRAAFRYAPAVILDSPNSQRLSFGKVDKSPTATLVVERMDLQSFVTVDGHASHHVSYVLNNEGAAILHLKPPAGAVWRKITVNDQSVALPAQAKPPVLSMPIAIPEGRVEVAIDFDTRQAHLGVGTTIHPPLAHEHAQVLSGVWKLWIPKDFSVASTWSPSWRERLFGPLGRQHDVRPMQLLIPASWQLPLLDFLAPTQGASSASSTALPGWNFHQATFGPYPPAAVTVTQAATTSAWAIIAFLLCVVCGGWLRRRRRELFVVALGVAAGLSLLLPGELVTIASGAVLGLFVSLLVPPPANWLPQPPGTARWPRYATLGTTLLAVLSLVSHVARGDSEQPAARALAMDQSATIYQVLIPTDKDGRIAGSKYFVSEELAQRLLKKSTRTSPAVSSWVLKDTAYKIELNADPQSSRVTASQCTITCALDVLARDTTIVLPFVQQDAEWNPTAMLDGVPMSLEWHEPGNGCALAIAEPGQYALTLTCVPRTLQSNRENRARLRVPKHRGATLRVIHPAGLTNISVASAAAQVLSPTSDGTQFNLGDSSHIELSWPQSLALATEGGTLAIIALEWLRVDEAQVELWTRYVYDSPDEDAEEMIVRADPAWELILPEEPTAAKQLSPENGYQRVRAASRSLGGAKYAAELKWRLREKPALGSLRLPLLELETAASVNRWRAVSSGPALECSMLNATAVTATAAEFSALWGSDASADTPYTVLRNVAEGEPWGVSITPRVIDSQLSETLHLAYSSGEADIVYEAAIVPGSNRRFQLALRVPGNLDVKEMVLATRGRDVPLRWVNGTSDQINVFFGQEMTDAYRLTLRGVIRGAPSEQPLPLITAVGATGPIMVHCYRSDDVTLDVQQPQGVADLPDVPVESPPQDWNARHVTGFQVDPAAAAELRISTSPNEPVLTGDTLISLQRNAAEWTATFASDFEVANGMLDELKLTVPAAWVGPFTLDSSNPASLTAQSDGKGSSELQIRFVEPVASGSAVTLKLSGPMSAVDSNAALPNVSLQPKITGRRFASVPRAQAGQPIAWSLIGTRPAEAPAKLLSDPSQYQQLELVSERAYVAARPQSSSSTVARARLADTTVTTDAKGNQLIVTEFVIEANGLDACSLKVPDHMELVLARWMGRPALATPLGPHEWKIVLGRPDLPHSLVVTTRSVSPAVSKHEELVVRPTLHAAGVEIPVEINLWSFGYPKAISPRLKANAELTAEKVLVLRFDRLLRIAESATPAAINSPSQEKLSWFRSTANQLRTLRDIARSSLALASRPGSSRVSFSSDEQFAESSRRFDTWLARCVEQFEVSSEESEHASGDPSQRMQPPGASPWYSERWMYCASDGRMDRLAVAFPAGRLPAQHPSYLGLLAVAGVTLACLALLRSPVAQDLPYQWPHVIGFLLGLAYWAWLEPSWLGLVIAGACVALALRAAWPGRAIRMDASTVVRSRASQ